MGSTNARVDTVDVDTSATSGTRLNTADGFLVGITGSEVGLGEFAFNWPVKTSSIERSTFYRQYSLKVNLNNSVLLDIGDIGIRKDVIKGGTLEEGGVAVQN